MLQWFISFPEFSESSALFRKNSNEIDFNTSSIFLGTSLTYKDHSIYVVFVFCFVL